ncbi:MAG: FAD-binding domain-containing protein [Bacteroidota bacterium]
MTAVVWLKRDLRVTDHAPLYEAAQSGQQVLPLYVVEPDYWQQPDTSRRHWHFIHDSLQVLQQDLVQLGQALVVRVGEICSVLTALQAAHGVTTLYSHEETGNGWTYRRDKRVAAWCRERKVAWHEFPTNGVVRRLSSRDAWSKIHQQRIQAPIVPMPRQLIPVSGIILGKIPTKEDPIFGHANIGQVQHGGRKLGQQTLDSFLQERAARYTASLSKPEPALQYCSRLSTHITYGTLSVREIFQSSWNRLRALDAGAGADASQLRRGIRNFLSRLHWHCHFMQKLEDQPGIEYQCTHPAFEGMREAQHRPDYLQAWYEGRTGYPLVDACMRSLHKWGWLNFRMRAMVVSFASYDLWLDWRQTGPLLAQLFTDYEPGIHYSQLQMQSGVTGINAIRMYDPTKQLRDHDPEGHFVRQYIPELQDAPATWLTSLNRQPDLFAQYQPPGNYPAPIVNHGDAVKYARERITAVRRSDRFKELSKKVYQKLGSRKRPAKRRAVKARK